VCSSSAYISETTFPEFASFSERVTCSMAENNVLNYVTRSRSSCRRSSTYKKLLLLSLWSSGDGRRETMSQDRHDRAAAADDTGRPQGGRPPMSRGGQRGGGWGPRSSRGGRRPQCKSSMVVFLGDFNAHLAVIFVHLGSRVVKSVLDSGAQGPGFKSQSRSCRITVLCKLFTPIMPLFTKQQNW